jgi:hypothetical protein
LNKIFDPEPIIIKFLKLIFFKNKINSSLLFG